MSKDLLVRMDVPIPTQSIVPHPGLIFNRWLPIEREEALILDEKSFETKLWFDMTCLDQGFRQFIGEQLSTWANVTVARVFVDVTAKNISDELIEFIFATAETSDTSNPQMNVAYQDLNSQVIRTGLKCLDRLIAYFRNEKGQYWLDNYRYLYDTYLLDARSKIPFHVAFKVKARLRVNDSAWVKWNPPCTGVLAIPGNAEDRYVKREEWAQVTDFVKSLRRPTLVLELLANSENLARNGFRRSALIEAVSALEIAVISFSKFPRWDKITTTARVGRIDTDSLASQIEHLGFSASLRYLIPLLTDETILASDLLRMCQDAVTMRHNVVHNGQRDVNKKTLLPMIEAMRQTCAILQSLSAAPQE